MSSTATSALQIECAKPGCHWRGSPADAPGHTCPTPDPAASGAEDVERTTLAKALAEANVTYDEKTSIEGMRELLALATGDQTPIASEAEEAAAIGYNADPTDREGLEAWLLEHGQYDEQGVPQDERTATLDARLTVLLEEANDEPEPELDEIDTTLEGEAVELDDEPEPAGPEPEPTISEEEPDGTGGADPAPPAETPGEDTAVAHAQPIAENAGPRPWETVIAEALESQTAVKEYRWLVVWKPADATREAELIGRGKVKTEATVIQEDVQARGQLTGELVVVKTADVLKAAEELAAEVERKRQNVEEPDVVVPAAEPEPEVEPEPAEPKPSEAVQEAARAAQDAQPGPGQTGAKGEAAASLFDASDFDREDLAIPKVDGFQIDRIGLDFGGGVMLDRSTPADVELYNRIRMGQEVELWITAKGAGTGAKPATNREGDLDVIVGKKTLRVEGIRVLKPEELAATEAKEILRAAARKASRAGMTDDQIEEAVIQALAEVAS